MITFIICFVLAISAIIFLMSKEEKIVEKANSSSGYKAAFYHLMSKLCSGSYEGYRYTDGENEAIKEYLNRKTKYENHPIGSYFKMKKEMRDMLKMAGNFYNYNLNFNLGEVGTGVTVIIVFVAVVALGVVYC